MKRRKQFLQAKEMTLLLKPFKKEVQAFLLRLGVDQTVLYLVGGRLWSVLSGLITMLMVLKLISPEEQGFYFAFSSLIGMQVLLELGMGVVVLQYASHDMAGLQWDRNGTLNGDGLSKTRLKSLLVLVLRWYGAVAVLMIVFVLPLGWTFFLNLHPHTNVFWQTSWFFLVVFCAINIFSIPLFAILEGCGDVLGVARARFQQNLCGSLLAWTVLFAGGGLLALPAMTAGYAVVFVGRLAFTHRRFFLDLLTYGSNEHDGIVWRNEIWPFQWKIGLSWVSGYFMFQLFTPVLFASRGAVEAGQMGLSLAIASAMSGIASTWIAAKSPMFGMLIAQRDYAQLDSLFKLTIFRSAIVFTTGAFVLVGIRFGLERVAPLYGDRMLSPGEFSMLMLATFFNLIAYAFATYLRAHKEDPFLGIGVISAALISVWTIWSAPVYGAAGVMVGYVTVSAVIGGACGTWIFVRKRRQWRALAKYAGEESVT